MVTHFPLNRAAAECTIWIRIRILAIAKLKLRLSTESSADALSKTPLGQVGHDFAHVNCRLGPS